MESYRLYYHESVDRAMRLMGQNQQAAVRSISRDIVAHPFRDPDYLANETGLTWSCVMKNSWAVVFQTNHTAREVRIGLVHRFEA